MSTLRSWKSIIKEVFEQTQNTLINQTPDWFVFFSKLEDKINQLENLSQFSNWEAIFVWVWAKRSYVFKLDSEDIDRLLSNYKTND